MVRLAATREETPDAAVAELPAEGSSPPVAEPVDEPIAPAARDLETPAANAAPQLTIETLLAERTAIEPLEPLANGTPTLAGGPSATEMTTSARGRRGVVLREGGTVGGPHAVVFEAASEAARAADGEREGDGPGLDLIGALVGGSGGGTPVCKPRRIPQRRVVHRR